MSNVDLNLISPFITTGPTPDSMFFGREHELRMISEHASIASYVLIGGRRIGKTSILNRLKQVHLLTAGYRAYYHDCSFTPTQRELIQAIILDKSWFPNSPSIFITSFANIIQELPHDRPLIILLDEADKLIVSAPVKF